MAPHYSIFIHSRSIFLIGMMGSGKSTTGEQLAKLLGWPFIDLDLRIEDQQRCSIAQIFSEKGEKGFRLLEREALQSVLALASPAVIACGGGTPCFFDNMENMKNSGWVVYLQTPVEVLKKRLVSGDPERPLLSDRDLEKTLQTLLEKRSASYREAHVVYEQDEEGMDVAEDLYRHLIDISGH